MIIIVHQIPSSNDMDKNDISRNYPKREKWQRAKLKDDTNLTVAVDLGDEWLDS